MYIILNKFTYTYIFCKKYYYSYFYQHITYKNLLIFLCIQVWSMQSRQIVCTRPIWNPFPKRPQWRAVVFRDAGSVLRWPGIDYKSGPFLLQKPKCSEILSITFIFALLSCSGVKNKLISHGSKIFLRKVEQGVVKTRIKISASTAPCSTRALSKEEEIG